MPHSWKSALYSACAGAVMLLPAGAQAQPRTAIAVAQIASAQTCTVYQGIIARSDSFAASRSSGAVTAWGAAGSSASVAASSSSFATYFVKDCTRQFEGIRTAMEAALSSSGTVAVGPGGYVLRGRMESVATTGGGYSERSVTGRTYGATSQGLLVTFNVTVADRAGRIVFGAPVTTQIDTASAMVVNGTTVAGGMSGDGVYGVLQRQVAMIAARKVAFHFRPMVVVTNSGRQIQLNYGGPLLEVGTLLTVTSPDGGASVRYRVTSTSERSALAEPIGGGDEGRITPGSRAMVIEATDPAASMGGMERVELP
ncbi:hypothetical protein GTZ99_13655 [Novosphingobium sp. FSY-8]|uniref:Uncharacterized protein n=1 Tax=Novosphingobium ovatum TaxID=1908523 RepID=A0ABW9XGC5_9SPHN|nr:hypothetical protein [Novosphingobium ovatum]NBC37595.1 hypothetical protein [Novosphingobium ovatum]